jgi:hypothetical protein
MFIKITGFLGGKKAVKSLGAFCLVLFGVTSVILSLRLETIRPSWVIWFFWGGTALGLIMLIGGIFADDVSSEK